MGGISVRVEADATRGGREKLALWGIVSVLLFGGILFASTAFGGLVSDADAAQSGSGSGLPLMIVTGLLAVSFLIAASLFFRSVAMVLERRRGIAH